MNKPLLDRAALTRIITSEKIVFFTGAGISAESGIPTFRGKDGLWKKFKPEELANFDAFIKNPELVWEWYKYRQQIISKAIPNAGHTAIAEFQDNFPSVTVITQNVDNLHKRAGSKVIYELHGNIERNYCIRCGRRDQVINEEQLPLCECGGLVRPDVVWFGEMLPEDQYIAAEIAASQSEIFFVVGTSAVVYPAASLVFTAKRMNAFIIEINIEETEVSNVSDRSFLGESGKVLPQILQEIKSAFRNN